jgi:hypothetical protein
MSQQNIVPMKTSGIQHLIERTYREGGRYQWVRETLLNALEAGATRIEYGVEWKGVEKSGVYRRYIADNGAGMNAEQLEGFFNTFGAGGKNIGGVHENFGVGSKTSLLPWNHHGIVVLSWVKGEASMIWMRQDPKTQEYGLRVFETVDPETKERSLETVIEPFDEWAEIKPGWIKDHGTVVVLLGNGPRQDTLLGDPQREEADLKGIGAYLNRRLWLVPKGVEIYVEETRASDKDAWPRSAAEAYGPEPASGQDRRINRRTVLGADHYIRYPGHNFRKGALASSGTVPTKDGTQIHWFLWDGERPAVQSYASMMGYVSYLYRNELFEPTSHLSVYRSFGVTAPEVRSRLWLVLQPREQAQGQPGGVYPRTDRNALLVQGEGLAGEPLPIHTWAAEFADNMPGPIREALRKARSQRTDDVGDEAQLARLAERFGKRWSVSKLRAVVRREQEEKLTVEPGQLGSTPSEVHAKKKRKSRDVAADASGGTKGDLTLGGGPGHQPAARVRVAGGIPSYRIVASDEMEPEMLASWMPHDPVHPEGVVLINGDHPVVRDQVNFWASQYPDAVAPDVERDVLAVYGLMAVAKVAHSERFRGILPSVIIDEQMRSDEALTMSLLGLVAEEHVIAARLGAKYGKRRPPQPATRPVAQPRVASA